MNVTWPWNRCGRYAELISLAAAGVLPDAERSRLDAHLRGCAACRCQLAAVSGVTRQLASAADREDRVVPPAALTARWEAQVRAEAVPRRQSVDVANRRSRFNLMEGRLTWAALGACWALILGLRWLTPDVSKAPLPVPPLSWAELRIALKRSPVPERLNAPVQPGSGRPRSEPKGAGRENAKTVVHG